MQKIIMEHHTLQEVEPLSLPKGYCIAPYKRGDEEAWLAIHRDADHFSKVPPSLFGEQFGMDELILQERVFFLYYKRETIGTAAAWYNRSYKEGEWGRIHWVAIKEKYQGRGLGKALLSFVCKQLVILGYQRAYLSTALERERAVLLYKRVGFVTL